MKSLFRSALLAHRFRDYKPQAASISGTYEFLAQFSAVEQDVVVKLLNHLRYTALSEFESELCRMHDRLVENLLIDGLQRDSIIYVAYDDAGSSSPVVLKMIRDHAQLELHDSVLLFGKDTRGLVDATTRLRSGAIIYVDDFVGTGKQFCDSHGEIVKSLTRPSFSQFLLVHTACQEAVRTIGIRSAAVELVACHLHGCAERPLHPFSALFTASEREIAQQLCARADARYPIGFASLASMVAFAHGVPDNTPRVLRGSDGQSPLAGLLPRPVELKRRSVASRKA